MQKTNSVVLDKTLNVKLSCWILLYTAGFGQSRYVVIGIFSKHTEDLTSSYLGICCFWCILQWRENNIFMIVTHHITPMKILTHFVVNQTHPMCAQFPWTFVPYCKYIMNCFQCQCIYTPVTPAKPTRNRQKRKIFVASSNCRPPTIMLKTISQVHVGAISRKIRYENAQFETNK